MLSGQPEELIVFLLNHACERSDKVSGSLHSTKRKLENSRQKNKNKSEEIKSLKEKMKTEKKNLEKQIEGLERENENLRNSTAYKVGSGIVWLPKKVKHLFK